MAVAYLFYYFYLQVSAVVTSVGDNGSHFFDKKRYKMQHMTLKIASINHPPYIILNETQNGVWEITGGIDAYIINTLKEKFCFKYKVILPAEREWGRIKEGRWTGVIGMVNRNEVDLGISNMMITEERYDSVSLSVPYNSDGWVLCSLAPRASENKHAVLHPFTLEVWCALFVSILISSFFLFSLQIIRSRFRRTPILSWRNTLWNIVAVLCQEGVKLSKMKSSALTYFIVWTFSTMILQVSYGGTLIGFLTFPTMEHSIDSLEELAEAIQNKEIKLSIKKYSMAQALLGSHEKFGVIFKESLQSDPKSLVSDHVEGFQGVLNKKFVFVGNEYGVKYDIYLVDFTKLQLTTILGRSYVSVVFAKNFRYKKDFNMILRRMTERGLIHKWKSDMLLEIRHRKAMFYERDKKLDSEDFHVIKTKALKITPLQGAFILLVIGHALALTVLIIEILYARHHGPKLFIRTRHR